MHFFKDILDQLADVRRELAESKAARATYWQRGTVYAYFGVGSTTCTVQYPSGALQEVVLPWGYAPVVGEKVAVVTGAQGSFIACRLTV
jgi:hypothetical protein